MDCCQNQRQTIHSKAEQKDAKSKAFDLLDALTRSGVLPILTGASLHVVLATTHCFDRSLMNTIVKDNINPIEKVERSSVIVASLIHGAPVQDMIEDSALERIRATIPELLE